jgi:hypothetical protein
VNFSQFYYDFSVELDAIRYNTFNLKSRTKRCTRRIFLATEKSLIKHNVIVNAESFWHGKSSEFMCDYIVRDSSSYEVKFALESEWGKKNSKPMTLKLVVDDFLKLVNIKSLYKVMVFGYADLQNEKLILNYLKSILINLTTPVVDNYWIVSATWNDEMNSKTIKGYEWKGNSWQEI